MADRRPEHGPDHKARMHAMGSAGARAWASVLLVKLLALAGAGLLFWVLEVEFGVGVAALVLLHLAVAGALVVYATQARTRRK